jgi:hypothetical protein
MTYLNDVKDVLENDGYDMDHLNVRLSGDGFMIDQTDTDTVEAVVSTMFSDSWFTHGVIVERFAGEGTYISESWDVKMGVIDEWNHDELGGGCVPNGELDRRPLTSTPTFTMSLA